MECLHKMNWDSWFRGCFSIVSCQPLSYVPPEGVNILIITDLVASFYLKTSRNHSFILMNYSGAIFSLAEQKKGYHCGSCPQ